MKKTVFLVLGAVVFGFVSAHADSASPASPAAPAAAAPAAIAVRVEKVSIGTAIDNKEISGEAAQFADSVNRVYCWTKVSADQAPVTLKHVWYADGKQEAEVPLEIKYTSMRTWSSKSVWPGSWKVDVKDDKGTVLASKSFTVSKEAAPAAQTSQPAGQAVPQVGQ